MYVEAHTVEPWRLLEVQLGRTLLGVSTRACRISDFWVPSRGLGLAGEIVTIVTNLGSQCCQVLTMLSAPETGPV